MRLGVIGGGVVGAATARAFLEHAEVRVYDIVRERATHTLAETLDAELVFVCLPTPQKAGSLACDLSAVHNFLCALADMRFAGNPSPCAVNLVLRSTLPIGTTRQLRRQYNLPNLVHSPEFLTARTAFVDAQTPTRNIVGGPKGVRPCEAERRLIDLYYRRFPGVPIHLMTSDESEAVKLFQNGFFATKVAYFNEVRALADKLGLDWDAVRNGVLSDGRIAHAHTQVPGHDGRRGFGGECLRKDLANLIHCIEDAGAKSFVTAAALMRNRIVDRREEA